MKLNWLYTYYIAFFIASSLAWIKFPDDPIDQWLEHLNKISERNFLITDDNLKTISDSPGKCLGVIYRKNINKTIPSIILTSWDCSSNISVICKSQASQLVSSNNPLKFPCVESERIGRVKRNVGVTTGRSIFNVGGGLGRGGNI